LGKEKIIFFFLLSIEAGISKVPKSIH